MQAARSERYGRLAVEEVERPEPAAGEVLVRVHAASVNPVDWYALRGRPYVARPMMGLRRPRAHGVGSDFAGVVAAVGADVEDMAPGDEVYGCTDGALAEYVVAGKAVARKPETVSFEEAAAVPVAGFAALQALRDHGGVGPGSRVLVNGGSGGVGSFAVQIARALGAEVDAVCSTGNVGLVRTLGASRVFDYTREDATRSGARYDVVVDVAGSRSWPALRRVLAPGGTVVLVGGPRGRRVLGPLGHIAGMKLGALLGRGTATFFVAKPNRDDLVALRELIDDGRVRPVVDRRFGLAQVQEAMRTMDDGHARAKVVVTLDRDEGAGRSSSTP